MIVETFNSYIALIIMALCYFTIEYRNMYRSTPEIIVDNSN